MGLDNYAKYGKDHHKYIDDPQVSNLVPNELFPDNCLCGGLFSGSGNSFRGKVMTIGLSTALVSLFMKMRFLQMS